MCQTETDHPGFSFHWYHLFGRFIDTDIVIVRVVIIRVILQGTVS